MNKDMRVIDAVRTALLTEDDPDTIELLDAQLKYFMGYDEEGGEHTIPEFDSTEQQLSWSQK